MVDDLDQISRYRRRNINAHLLDLDLTDGFACFNVFAFPSSLTSYPDQLEGVFRRDCDDFPGHSERPVVFIHNN